MFFEKKYKMYAWALSGFIGLVILAYVIFGGLYFPTPPYFIPLSQGTNNLIVLGILLSLVIPAYIEWNNHRWLRGVDANAPRLLRDVTETVQSGVPLFRALEEASERDYGPISKSLETAMVKFHFTSDLEGALTWLGETLIRPSMRRISTILIEAHKTGGDIIDVLNTSVDLFTKLEEHQEERRSQMRPYMSIVYLGTVIFLIISWVIITQFLAPLIFASSETIVGSSGILRTLLDIEFYVAILFWAAIMESIFGGLVAGKILEGRVSAGLIHSVVLLVITIVFFNAFSI